ncbi:TadE/TadG family type IV pilus assembly protein [Streptomyces sp. BI20]|uniref:TadE/TadG family type IV pilus assembly protein n=1 Tax=Streptomyces sp. BI20 TaxID=3403460 RepID=UPI003C737A0E
MTGIRARRDRGQVAIEFIVWTPILLLVALAAIQLGWVAYVYEQADTAARTAARVEAQYPGQGRGEPAGQAAIRSNLDARIVVGGGDVVTATATIRIKSVIPGLDGLEARRTASMPADGER